MEINEDILSWLTENKVDLKPPEVIQYLRPVQLTTPLLTVCPSDIKAYILDDYC